MKKIVFLILILSTLIRAIDELPLKEYISMISNDLGMTIVISDDIKETFTLLIPNDISEQDHLKIMIEILRRNDLKIESFENFFLISKVENKKDEEQLYSISLKNVDYDSIKPIFKTTNIKHSYIPTNKTLVFSTKKDKYIRLEKIISQLDVMPKQLKLKVTIVDTNLDKLKDYGTEIQAFRNLSNSSNFFFNLLAYPFTVKSEVEKERTSHLDTFIKFMDTNNISKLLSSPTVSLFDNKVSKFDVVKNIPYLNGTTTTSDGNQSSITSYSYRDVGLKITVLPKIYKDMVYLDLEIVSENVVNNSKTPTTSKSYIKQTIRMSKDKIFVLTGINQSQQYKKLNSTPYLSDIPFLGWLFKLDNTNTINSNLTIFLELVTNDSYVKKEIKDLDLPKLEKKKGLTVHEQRISQLLGQEQQQ